MLDVSRFFCKNPLIPVVVQDDKTNQVLMLAFTNEKALLKTAETRDAWFWSRSRGCLWHKGETSGNTLRVVSVTASCYNESLLFRVIPSGPACHTGSVSCFFNTVEMDEVNGTD
jgi:phosphoribosyl-AMP cyclohydrolase